MHSHSRVSLGETTDKLRILLREKAQISSTSTLDFQEIPWVLMTTDFDGEGENDVITVGTVLYKHFFAIKAPSVNVVGPVLMINTTDEAIVAESKIAIEGDYVTVYPTGSLESGFVLIQSNQTLTINTGAKVSSLQQNKCNMARYGSDPFVCIPKNSMQENFGVQEFFDTFNNQFPSDTPIDKLAGTLPTISANFTIYLLTFGYMDIVGASIVGPRIGVCAENIAISSSVLDTSAQGCTANTGPGHGKLEGRCAGSGGSHGGRGGYGGV